MRKHIVLMILTGLAGAVFAHSSATGVVKARMDTMSDIAESTKVLGTMIKSETIDPVIVREAVDKIAAAAKIIPENFKEHDLSKPTEALPAIWDNFDEFSAMADATAIAANALPDAADLTEFKTGFTRLGKTCSACHEKYRQPQ